jgi:hypothetical protein
MLWSPYVTERLWPKNKINFIEAKTDLRWVCACPAQCWPCGSYSAGPWQTPSSAVTAPAVTFHPRPLLLTLVLWPLTLPLPPTCETVTPDAAVDSKPDWGKKRHWTLQMIWKQTWKKEKKNTSIRNTVREVCNKKLLVRAWMKGCG